MTITNELLTKLDSLRNDLGIHLLEREVATEAALLALLTGEHLLLVGAPGTAKSLLTRGICERIEGGDYFEALLTRFSTPEELFGPLSLSALENDRYERVTSGTLVEAHIGFIDEIFKANSAILNSLLGILNERIYGQAGRSTSVPLLSLFAASNELPEDASLAAVYDRFLLRVEVPPLTEEDSVRKLLLLQSGTPASGISISELLEMQAAVANTKLGDDAIDAILAIKRGLEAEGIAASDRRWKSCGALVRAKAWMQGHTEATREHCDVLVNALWNEPAQLRAVERVVNKIANPLSLEAIELEDAAKDLFDQRPDFDHPHLTEALEPLLRQLGDIRTRLEQRIGSAPFSRDQRAKQALGKIAGWHRDLSQMALQSLSVLHAAPGVA
tara:strand:- start:3445 stop:4605 length:1161 start_codon:yes stop_codon:yes gene_type:complete